jgi:hypothetical protein
MLGFEITGWDYITFLTLAIVGFSFVLFIIWLGGLPGRIAIARKHPDADAVRVMGWAGLLVIVPWIQAFIWAFKPTDIIDIRRFPQEEGVTIDETIARLRGEPPADDGASPAKDDEK